MLRRVDMKCPIVNCKTTKPAWTLFCQEHWTELSEDERSILAKRHMKPAPAQLDLYRRVVERLNAKACGMIEFRSDKPEKYTCK